MTPERRRRFEVEWPALSLRLRGMLTSRGVPPAQHDDIVQETALRLYGSWERVMEGAPVWPFAKTIALNLLRDRARRPSPEPVDQIPDRQAQHDVEDAGLARLELERVWRALGGLTAGQRVALLAEVGVGAGRQGDAEKMMRSRARRKLSHLLERMPLVAPFRTMASDATWIVGGRDLVAHGAACFACVVVGVGSLTLVPTQPDIVPSGLEGATTDGTEGHPASLPELGTLDALSAGSVAGEVEMTSAAPGSDDGRRSKSVKGPGPAEEAGSENGSAADPSLDPPGDLPLPNARAPEAGDPAVQTEPVLQSSDGNESPVSPPGGEPEAPPPDPSSRSSRWRCSSREAVYEGESFEHGRHGRVPKVHAGAGGSSGGGPGRGFGPRSERSRPGPQDRGA